MVSVLPPGSKSKDILDGLDVFNPEDEVTTFVGRSVVPKDDIPLVTKAEEPNLEDQPEVEDLAQAIIELKPADVVQVVTEQNQDVLLSLDEANIPVLPVIVDEIKVIKPPSITNPDELSIDLVPQPVASMPSCTKASDATADPLANLAPSSFIIFPDIIEDYKEPLKILQESSRNTDSKVLFRNKIFHVQPMFEIDTITKIRQYAAVDSMNRLATDERGLFKINALMDHSSIILITSEDTSSLAELVEKTYICFRTIEISFFTPTTTTTTTTTSTTTTTPFDLTTVPKESLPEALVILPLEVSMNDAQKIKHGLPKVFEKVNLAPVNDVEAVIEHVQKPDIITIPIITPESEKEFIDLVEMDILKPDDEKTIPVALNYPEGENLPTDLVDEKTPIEANGIEQLVEDEDFKEKIAFESFKIIQERVEIINE